jgi:hypothetical protein
VKGLGDTAVHSVQPVQRRLRLGDLHVGHCEAALQRSLTEIAGEERLASPVLAADRLERGAALCGGVEIGVERRREPLQADGEQVQSARRDRAAAQCVDDFPAPPRGGLLSHGETPNCSRSSGSSSTTVTPSGSCISTA